MFTTVAGCHTFRSITNEIYICLVLTVWTTPKAPTQASMSRPVSRGHTSQLFSNSITQNASAESLNQKPLQYHQLVRILQNYQPVFEETSKRLQAFFPLFNGNTHALTSLLRAGERTSCTFEQSDRNSNCYSDTKAWSGATPLILLQISGITLCIFCYRERSFNILSLNVLAATYSQSEETHWSMSPFPSLLIFYLVSRSVRQKTMIFREIFKIFKGFSPQDTRENERVVKKLNSGLQQ